MKWIITAWKGLSWVEAAGGISWLGFLGPVPAIIAGIAQLIWKLVSIVFAGIADIVASPPRAIAACAVAMIAFMFGLHYGRSWDSHLVAVANGEAVQAKADIAALETKLKAAQEADDGKAKAAIDARDAAKSLGSKSAGPKRVHAGTASASAKDSHSLTGSLLGF